MNKKLKNNHIPVLFLLLVGIASCEKPTITDCSNIVISDTSVVSPPWLKHLMDSLENVCKEENGGFVYDAYTIDYQQNTYIDIHEMLYSQPMHFYTCTGVKIENNDPLIWDAYEAIKAGSTNRQFLFHAVFCYTKMCTIKQANYRHRDSDKEHAVDDPAIADCRKDIVIIDGKLLSPQWLVQVMNKAENNAITLNQSWIYNVIYSEYKKQRYLCVRGSNIKDSTTSLNDFYTCSGVKIENGSSLYANLFNGGVNSKIIIFARFLYDPESDKKKSEYELNYP
jgi:hypothetical protein